MKCYECAYFGIERNEVIGMYDVCKHPSKYIPPSGFSDTEHDCEFFRSKSGISKWDSYSQDEKEQILRYLEKQYEEKPITDLTLEEAKSLYIRFLKEIDSNVKINN